MKSNLNSNSFEYRNSLVKNLQEEKLQNKWIPSQLHTQKNPIYDLKIKIHTTILKKIYIFKSFANICKKILHNYKYFKVTPCRI